MEFDTYGFGRRLNDIAGMAREARRLGFSTIWFTEAGHNPYLPCAVATDATDGAVGVGTSIAVAFPRSPMVTAQLAWDLADQSDGNFQLGLGTQVKAHIVRRFSTEFSRPVARMREYVLALRAIFRAFQGEEQLAFSGDFYSFSLLTDFFSGGPIEFPDVPIQIAGVNTGLARLAGEVCDGFHVHPFHSREYLTEVIRPAVEEGARKTGRSIDDVTFIAPVFIVVGNTELERAALRDAARQQLAFYASTPTYEPVLAHHGFGEAADELRRLMRTGDLAAMASVLTDDMLAPYTVTATWEELPDALLARYGGVADRVLSYLGTGAWPTSPEAAERWAAVAAELRRRTIARGT
ncbi:MAG TPA: TIGR03617 family F420-dependent LLM class oxidoreductase [Acidimicrobiia bacterium]|nr:TIGR03617 family F420-dependent LLM class oxidoreductase [Acidimicrobiia bacterium]